MLIVLQILRKRVDRLYIVCILYRESRIKIPYIYCKIENIYIYKIERREKRKREREKKDEAAWDVTVRGCTIFGGLRC